MRKENIFLVTGRLAGADGALMERVVCASDDLALSEYLERAFPGFEVAGVVNMAGLEAKVTQIKQALAGHPEAGLPVYVADGLA